jgi:hypothetical protein
MKARVKATGEIGIVANIDLLFGNKGYRYQSYEVEIIDSYADIDTAKDPDYWTRLEHQYAGMAMQGLLSNERCWEENADKIAEVAICYAKELVKGLRVERSN